MSALVVNGTRIPAAAVGVQTSLAHDWTDWLVLDSVTLLKLDQHVESPSLYVGTGRTGRYFTLDPDAVLYVRSAGGEQGWPVRDITSLNLEPKAV